MSLCVMLLARISTCSRSHLLFANAIKDEEHIVLSLVRANRWVVRGSEAHPRTSRNVAIRAQRCCRSTRRTYTSVAWTHTMLHHCMDGPGLLPQLTDALDCAVLQSGTGTGAPQAEVDTRPHTDGAILETMNTCCCCRRCCACRGCSCAVGPAQAAQAACHEA